MALQSVQGQPARLNELAEIVAPMCKSRRHMPSLISGGHRKLGSDPEGLGGDHLAIVASLFLAEFALAVDQRACALALAA